MIKCKNQNIYVIMYHYVREIKKSKYPNLKGLEFKEFKNQINYFKSNFNILNNEDFLEILDSKKIPKKKSILLTFDDGYKDHYEYVFPHLSKKKISGIFYPPIKTIKNSEVLDVNKIHFIMEKNMNSKSLLNLIYDLVKKYDKKFNPIDFKKIKLSSRYDNKEKILIKSLLQYILPKKIRKKILDQTFEKILDINEADFAKQLYINSDNIIEMNKNKMHFGSHGYNHLWWGHLNKNEQYNEINKSIKFFKKINVYNQNFSLCYPYGSYNSTTIKLMKHFKISFALTTEVNSINQENISNLYNLPRYDTNDFK